MVKRLERKCCANCIFLNKSKVEKCKETNFYRYGCNNNISEYIIGYIQKDSQLKTMGCSDCNKIQAGQLFRFFTKSGNKYVCQYCGRIGDKYLIWNQTLQNFKTVQKDWLRKHKENIQLKVLKENYLEGRTEPINTLEEKERFQRGLAKRRKERFLREHGKDNRMW